LPGIARLFIRPAGPIPGDDWPVEAHCQVTDFRKLLRRAEPPIALEPVTFSDVQLIMYTSGTTGPSKGVLCTHSQEQTGGLFMAQQMGYGESDVLYTCLPLFHANALRVTVNAALWAGATVALARRFSARQFWKDIQSSGATQFNALGAMASIILRQAPSPSDRDHKVRLCNVVPALPPEVAREFSERFGVLLTSLYGSTEACCPVFAFDVPAEKGASCGRLVYPFELRVADDDDFEVPHGQVGELLIRTREPWHVFQGYFDMPAETQAALRNGWFHSGDRGYRDQDGFFYFVDRKKESIRRRGENISSYEVELGISQHPAVLEVAVVPYPSDLGEDDVLAFNMRAAFALALSDEGGKKDDEHGALVEWLDRKR
jgi:crotonobetaine/carnitine-CoA ligase